MNKFTGIPDEELPNFMTSKSRFMRLNEINEETGSVQTVIVNGGMIQRFYESKKDDTYPGIWIVFSDGCTIKVAEDVQTIIELDERDIEFE